MSTPNPPTAPSPAPTPIPGPLAGLGKTAATYARDVIERVVWTFLLSAGAAALAAGPANLLQVSFWHGAALAALAAAGSAVKGVLAQAIGDRHSASTAPGV